MIELQLIIENKEENGVEDGINMMSEFFDVVQESSGVHEVASHIVLLVVISQCTCIPDDSTLRI